MKARLTIAVFACGLLLLLGRPWVLHGQETSPRFNGPITNLWQLNELMNSNERLMRDVQLEATVCSASEPSIGVAILRDSTGTEFFHLGAGIPKLVPGDRIQIIRKRSLLRRRDLGIHLTVLPVVDNNGIHARSTSGGGIGLQAGRHSITLEWFNNKNDPSLEVKWQIPGTQSAVFPSTNLFCAVLDEKTGQTVMRPGLLAECCEGDWERVPDFDLLSPLKTVVATNFNVGVGTRDKFVAVRFQGFFDAPTNGIYGFTTRSADGSLLFVDGTIVPITKVGEDAVPGPARMTINEPMSQPTHPQWLTVEGRVTSVKATDRGTELILESHRNTLRARIVDARGLVASNLLQSWIRVTGAGWGGFNLRGEAVLGRVVVIDAQGVEILESPKPDKNASVALIEAEQVQGLTLDDAKRQIPVHLRGIVTSKGATYDKWISLQDDTRGIFVNIHNVSNFPPACGDFCEVIGKSDAGGFAPVVLADRLVRLGQGEWPEPKRLTWDELNNGSMDVQWVEFKGLVTDVQANTLSMLLPAGQLNVKVEGPTPADLEASRNAVIRIRGVLFAVWNATREVRVGSILMRNASLAVETSAPDDPFDAVLKSPRDLLLFDAQATTFRRVKVKGQIVYADATKAFLQQDGEGLRVMPAPKANLHPGDQVEAVGYPSIGPAALLLREAVIRKTGTAELPPAKILSDSQFGQEGVDATRVRIEGQLLGWHFEHGQVVLEMQSRAHLFLARLAGADHLPLAVESKLALEGVYFSLGGNQRTEDRGDSFELLLNSPGDILVLSKPSWWTWERLLILVGILSAILVFGAVWITQLRRLVEQRTAQLRLETMEREQAEKLRVLEVERSRIAGDLHDDLGASLTEITILASKAQRTTALEQGVSALLQTITDKARELVVALDIIVWAVDPKDNSLQSVADYLCDFTDEYLSPSGIACRFDVPVALPSIALEGRLRHALFLAVKESLNNIVRHAAATEVKFQIVMEKEHLEIIIVDNGKGFDAPSPQGGKGLKNLPRRLSHIGGRCEIRSAVGKGTTVKIELPLPMPEFAREIGPGRE